MRKIEKPLKIGVIPTLHTENEGRGIVIIRRVNPYLNQPQCQKHEYCDPRERMRKLKRESF